MSERRFLYRFEELTDDLPRPPLAALRALGSMSYVVSPKGWRELPLETRKTIAREGARDEVGGKTLEAAVRTISLKHVKMMPGPKDPSPLEPPADLLAALGPLRRISPPEWQALRPLDRRVLSVLAHNTRLLAKAADEILPATPGVAGGKRGSAVVARCELTMDRDAMHRVMRVDFQGGQAFVLARAAGRRAAQRVAELFDRQADSMVGPIELDWSARESEGVVFWQAHVSAWDGAFLPSASLLAATTAAIALHDMVRELDPRATLGAGRVVDEPWEVGRGELEEPTTALYGNLGGVVERVLSGNFDTIVGATYGVEPESRPSMPAAAPSSPRPSMPVPSSSRAVASRRSAPSSRLFVLVSVIAVLAVLGLIGIALDLARASGRH